MPNLSMSCRRTGVLAGIERLERAVGVDVDFTEARLAVELGEAEHVGEALLRREALRDAHLDGAAGA